MNSLSVSSSVAASGAASSSWVASSPLPGWQADRPSADLTVPPAGLALLALLLLVAVWAWRFGSGERRTWGSLLPRHFGIGRTTADNSKSEPVISCASRLDAGTRLYVVDWHGESLLLCVSSQSPPAVLARHRNAPEGGSNAA